MASPSRARRIALGLALGVTALVLAGEASAVPREANLVPFGSLESAASDPAPLRCTRATCAPRPGDSPWTLASFGLAVAGAGWFGGRRTAPRSLPQSRP